MTANHLTPKQHQCLELLADSGSPMSRLEIMSHLGMENGFAEMAGAFTKPNLGVQNDNSLGKLGLIRSTQIRPEIVVVITANGRKTIDFPLLADSLPPEEAADDDIHQDSFVPPEFDSRISAFSLIKLRRGQHKFRNKLINCYGAACMISGCTEKSVLEASHIAPYRGEPSHDLENGLLLRADLHTLFDADRLGIDPETLQIHIHPAVIDPQYRTYDGVALQCGEPGPSLAALRQRWSLYLQNRKAPVDLV